MRILKSFDTKIDAEELLEAVDKYGEGNVILVKKHWVKLIGPLIGVIVSIVLLCVLLYVIYSHLYNEHKAVFRVLATIYTYTTFSWSCYAIYGLMRNIIGQIKAEKKYIDKIGIAKRKQIKFEKFMRRTFITFGGHILVFLFNATVPFLVIKSTGIGSIAVTIGALILDFIFIVILNRVMYRIMEYEMNFSICTKNHFSTYNQQGFFRTKTTNISTPAIRVIQDSKEGVFGALLAYGVITIHTDGDIDGKGGKTLELKYIPEPKRLAKKLNSIIDETRGE